MGNKKFSTSRKLFLVIVVFALLKSTFFSHFGFGLLDEGESLHNATRILDGQLPYKDFFAIFPPLDNYFFAFIFSIFGKSVIVPRLVMSVIFAFAPGFMFLIMVKFTKRYIAVLIPILLVLLDLNVERLYFFTPIFIAICLMDRKIFFSGLLLGFASLIRADIPGTYLIGLGVTLLICGLVNKDKLSSIFKNIFFLGIGYIIPIGGIVLWMYSQKILPLFFKSAFIDSVSITKLHDLPFPSIVNILPRNLSLQTLSVAYEALFAYLMLFTYIVGFVYLFKKWRKIIKKEAIIIGLLITGILALPYVFGRSDMGHIIKGGMPFLFLGAYLLSKLKNIYTIRFFQLLIAGIFIGNIFQSIWWIRFNNTKVEINSYMLRLSSKSLPGSTVVSASSLSDTVEFLQQTEPGEQVLALPYMAGIYFLADRQPPVEFNNLLAGFITTENKQLEFIDKAKAARVGRVVYAPNSGPKMQKSTLREYNPLVHTFLMNEYQVVEETPEGWLLMEKN